MKHCFNKKQIEKSFEYLFKNNNEDNDVIFIIENAKLWNDQIIMLNFLVSQIIQKNIKKGSLPNNFVDELYSLKEIGDIIIDEIDADFIEYLFTHKCISNKMNDNLIYFKEKQIAYDYRDQICY
jgi:hypothetical protein